MTILSNSNIVLILENSKRALFGQTKPSISSTIITKLNISIYVRELLLIKYFSFKYNFFEVYFFLSIQYNLID